MIEALTQLCQEKHIDELVLLDRLEQSLAKSYEDVLHINTKAGEKARVTISRETGKIYVYKLVPQEDSYDEELDAYTAYDEFDVTPSDTSRIAAQHAKAEINNLVRNAARTQIYKEFSDRLGDMITGTVLQVTNEFTILKIREGVEAELPYFDQRRNENERNERPAGERYAHNQRIKAIIIDVRDPNGNSAPVRGDRSRFDDRLDPVGACVGPKGSRVRAVVTELRGERVDVILWDEDPRKFVANALSPAKVSRVVVDPETGYATVIVPDDQLSLAIGKEGQNARLAARLTGLHIDIKNETLAADVLRELPVVDVPEEEEGGHRCEYVGENGMQCRNMARPGSRYCRIHEAMARYADVSVSDDPDSLI